MLNWAPATTASAQSNTPAAVPCNKATLHYTDRGFAFECSDHRNETKYLFVVRNGQFAERVTMVENVLRELNSRQQGSGRTRGGTGLFVSFRAPDQQATNTCNRVRQKNPNAECKLATDIVFR
ncbi:MAG: hypothetical protein AAGK02_06070 [Pseudomonadota bacterium]